MPVKTGIHKAIIWIPAFPPEADPPSVDAGMTVRGD